MRSLGLLFMRLSAGALFAAHGYPKLFGGRGGAVHPLAQRYLGQGFCQAMERGGVKNFSGALSRMGVPAPGLMAVVVGATEFVGGLLLITGLFTRLAALALAINMVFAIKLAHWKQGLVGSASGYMYALAMLGMMVGLAANGPGGCSVEGDRERWRGALARARRRRTAA